MALLQKDDILRSLRKIEAQAKAAHVLVDVAIYGGAALALAFDLRQATRDVDAVVRSSPELLRQMVADIAEEEGWPANWLNDGVKGFLSAKEDLQLMDSFNASAEEGGLRIYIPTPEYLFAMKCMAMRPEGVDGSHDISDIEALADIANIADVDAALTLVEAFYPAAIIPAKVRFGVEEIMARVVQRRDDTHDCGLFL